MRQNAEAPALSLAVRELAETIHRRGDIHVHFDRRTTGAEGIATQKRVQANLTLPYVREHPVSLDFQIGEEIWRLSGRIDGCDPVAGLVEEYKTTRADIDAMHAHIGHVHRAQLLLYGGLLAIQYPEISDWQMDLCYCHPDENTVIRRLGETLPRDELIEFLESTIEQWRERLLALYEYRSHRDRRLSGLVFPFDQFRTNQRALAGTVYKKLKAGTNLLLEAATGTGKSLATLYPAYKTLADSPLQRIFFLTSRTTGQDAAQAAAEQLHASAVRAVTIIAKEKACIVPGMPCDPQGCEYARGYYDRLWEALAEGLQAGHQSPADIKALAIKHGLCPFELSLDLSRWCDLVIMDYNYIFDPVVRLQRLSEATDAIVLIDEAHQLEARVRDMLSATLVYKEIAAVAARDSDAPEVIRKSAKTLARSFKRASKAFFADSQHGDAARWDDVRINPPKAFTDRAADFVALVSELGEEAFASDTVTALLFSTLRWQRAQEWLDLEKNAAAFFDRDANALKLLSLDASQHIAQTLQNYGPNAQFSGTLSPLPLYRQLHGDADAEVIRIKAVSTEHQLGLFVVPDVPTYFRSREASLPKLAKLVDTVISANPGNYFVAFPSFAYADAFVGYFSEHFPNQSLRVQARGSDLAERDAFVAHFRAAKTPTLGVVVLGGVFTESLDFADDALLGVIVVSVALPPPNNAREVLAEFYADRGESDTGQVVAYRQPAMVRVIQAAGRVVRSDTDRGVVCLVDARFQAAEFKALQPAHWKPKQVLSTQLRNSLLEFWQTS